MSADWAGVFVAIVGVALVVIVPLTGWWMTCVYTEVKSMRIELSALRDGVDAINDELKSFMGEARPQIQNHAIVLERHSQMLDNHEQAIKELKSSGQVS